MRREQKRPGHTRRDYKGKEEIISLLIFGEEKAGWV